MLQSWALCDLYLPYATGGGYLLGSQLVAYLAENAHHLTRFFNEDVSVGAWLAPLNITRVHDTRFDTEWKVGVGWSVVFSASDGCF